MRLLTERLVLREFAPNDLDVVVADLRDPRFIEYYPLDYLSEKRMEQLLSWFLAWQQEEPRYRWQMAVTLASTDELIGNCGIRLKTPGAAQAELGYSLSPACWGQGYATEAAQRMLAFAFDELGVHRVSAHVVESNARSIAVVRRLGFSLEGRVREDQLIANAWRDTLHYGLLAAEWATNEP